MKQEIIINDMRTSVNYLKKAEPILLDLLNGGRFLSVEGSDDEICRMLDLNCGIDYFHVYDNSGLTWGVASRFQKANVPYNTFTIRMARESGAKTEYEKRKYAIEHNGEYPYLTLQGYYNESGDILSLAIAKTTDIMDAIEKDVGYSQHTQRDKIGQASFYVIPWDKMIQAKYNVLIFEKGSKSDEQSRN